MTVILDLEIGGILHAAEGRSADAVILFTRKLKPADVQLQAFAMDMWPAHSLEVPEAFEDVPIVQEPYPIMATASAAIDPTRRDMSGDVTGQDQMVLKGSRYLLPKGGERLPAGLETFAISVTPSPHVDLPHSMSLYWIRALRIPAPVFCRQRRWRN